MDRNSEEFDEMLQRVNVLDLVSRRTRVSYRDLRQAVDELKTILRILHAEEMTLSEDVALLTALENHPDVRHYTIPTDEGRRNACVAVSNFIDQCQQQKENA